MKLIKKTNEEKGFTLIELVVVIAILAVLALILIPSITGYVKKADEAKNQANARSVYTAAMLVDQSEKFAENELYSSTTIGESGPMFELNEVVGSISETYHVKKLADGSFIVTVGESTFPETAKSIKPATGS